MIHSYKVSILSVYVFICNYSLSIISFSYYTFLFIFLYKKSLYITFHVVIKLLYINFHYYTLPYTHYTFSFSLTKLCLYKHIFLNPEPPTLCETTTSIQFSQYRHQCQSSLEFAIEVDCTSRYPHVNYTLKWISLSSNLW